MIDGVSIRNLFVLGCLLGSMGLLGIWQASTGPVASMTIPNANLHAARMPDGGIPSDASEMAMPADRDAFTFVRVQYDSSGGYGESWYQHEGRNWMRWETDYPRAELNLLFRLDQLTSLRVNPQPIVRRLESEDLADFPFLFMSDVGWQVLTQDEALALGDYLEKGGFLWIDDFWGEAEWKNLANNTRKMGTQWKWERIPTDHEIMTSVYPMEKVPQIPARIFFSSGWTHDPPQVHRWPAGGIEGVNHVNLMGLFDKDRRLVAVATHNTDIADGWEREGEDHEFFTRFSINSYAMSINIITYAMTH